MLSASINAGVGRASSPRNPKVSNPGQAHNVTASNSGLMPLLARYIAHLGIRFQQNVYI